MLVDYDARVRNSVLRWSSLKVLCLAAALTCLAPLSSQEVTPVPEAPKSEPQYKEAFSGPIVELTADKITVSRSVLGKPAEKRTFWIKADTKIEGKLKIKAKVTVGFVTTEDGDVAKLIVVRPNRR